MHLWIQCMVIRASRDQLAFDSSAGLIAVFHALLRLLAPRHPPHALSSLAALILPSGPPPTDVRGSPLAQHQVQVTVPRCIPWISNDPSLSFSGSCRDTSTV